MPECPGQLSLLDPAIEVYRRMHPCPVCDQDRVALGYYIANTTEAEIGDHFAEIVPCLCVGVPMRLTLEEVREVDAVAQGGFLSDDGPSPAA